MAKSASKYEEKKESVASKSEKTLPARSSAGADGKE